MQRPYFHPKKYEIDESIKLLNVLSELHLSFLTSLSPLKLVNWGAGEVSERLFFVFKIFIFRLQEINISFPRNSYLFKIFSMQCIKQSLQFAHDDRMQCNALVPKGSEAILHNARPQHWRKQISRRVGNTCLRKHLDTSGKLQWSCFTEKIQTMKANLENWFRFSEVKGVLSLIDWIHHHEGSCISVWPSEFDQSLEMIDWSGIYATLKITQNLYFQRKERRWWENSCL